MGKPLYTIVYASTAHSWVDEPALKHILKTARDYNGAHNLTGVLLHEDGNFLQTLEGYKEDLDLVFKKICSSQKHYDIQMILETQITSRSFADWSMGFIEMPKDTFLRLYADGWKENYLALDKAPTHIGAKMIQNFWKRHYSAAM